jgi:signal transduction histidine kinase
MVHIRKIREKIESNPRRKDADQMIRVFDNLLANAIKYSDKPGQITVRLTKRTALLKCESLIVLLD